MGKEHHTHATETPKATLGKDNGIQNDDSISIGADWDPAAEQALVRKIDLRIFPSFIILFILNFIDRNNFANARLKGLEKDLGLTDVEYRTCISILLVGYVLMQIPSNMILNSVKRPSLYLCTCVAIWGVISAATGSVHNATGAILCRFFLGCVEAAFFPGSLYFLSRWYTRKEMQLRVTILNAGNLAAQAFGGLIAAGILSNMEGLRGMAAWRWLFIIEGVITVFFALVCCLILPDYPLTTSWLSEKEKKIANGRLILDAGLGSEDPEEHVTSVQGFILAVKDPKVWLLGIVYFATIMGLSVSSQSQDFSCRAATHRRSLPSSSRQSHRLSGSTQPLPFCLPHHRGFGLFYFPYQMPGMLTERESDTFTTFGPQSPALLDTSSLQQQPLLRPDTLPAF
jgi:MFS family permease